MQQLHFDSPWAFLLLLILPLIWLRHRRRANHSAMQLPTLGWLNKGGGRHTSLRQIAYYIQEALRLLVFLLLVVALARPQLGNTEVERLTEGVDIIMAIDTSGSMQALDFTVANKRVDRLTVVKQVAADFIKMRTADRIGLVMFGDSAFTQCPPTLDHDVVLRFLDWSNIGMAGKGTAIGSALGVSIKRLDSAKSKSKIIILLTDGKSNAGNIDPLQAAKMAKALGIKIYSIGVGSKGPVPFPVQDVFGTRLIYQELELDDAALTAIAEATGGAFFNATDTASLQQIYAQIDAMEKTEIKTKEYKQYDDKFMLALMPAALLFFLIIVTENSWLRRLP